MAVKKIMMNLSDFENPESVTKVDLSNRDIPALNPEDLSKFVNLESLNVSGNRLKTIPKADLPKLTKLNCEDNMIQDISIVKYFPHLTELYIAGNPLTSADRYIAVSLLPNLKILDGKSCTILKEADKRTTEKLYPQAEAIWDKHFSNELKSAASNVDISSLLKQFSCMVKQTSLQCHDVPKMYKMFKIQIIAKEIIERKLKEAAPPALQSPRKKICIQDPSVTPTKACPRTETTPLRRSPRKLIATLKSDKLKNVIHHLQNQHITSPDKQSKKKLFAEAEDANAVSPGKRPKKLIEQLDFTPQIFIRCHARNNDPSDNATQVWRAIFEPDVSNPGGTTNIVATCGGDTVCLIDCSTGCVLKRYKHFNEDEDFYAIAWTVVTLKNNTKATLLAAAGREKEIVLIQPTKLVCYASFKAHTKPINCLLFHSSQPTWLFSGSTNGKIHLWDIGLPSSTPKMQHKKLMVLHAPADVLQLAFYCKDNLLLAGTEAGLSGWHVPDEITSKSDELMPSYALTPDKTNKDYLLVDGLTFISDDCICVKYAGSGQIHVCSMKGTFDSKPHKKSTKTQTIELHVLSVLEWSKCKIDYIYIGSHPGSGFLASGDNEGQVWVYDVKKFSNNVKWQKSLDSKESPKPPSVVLQWPEMTVDATGRYQVELPNEAKKSIINSVGISGNGEYMVACAEKNLVCIWKKTKE